MKPTPILGAVIGFTAAFFTPIRAAADVFQAPYGPGGTWRIYETFTTTLSFKDALAEARAKMDPATNSIPGSLVSITSAEKETFVRRTLNRLGGEVWMGLTDRVDVAVDAEESQNFGTVDEANRINGWKWTNGDVYEYRNWSPGEPNDSTGEDGVHFSGGSWNDNKTGYALDDPSSAAGSTNETAIGGASFRYIVEFANNSPTPLPGIRQGAILPPNAAFNLPVNTAGNWSLREVRDLTLLGNITDSVDQLLSGTGTLFEAQVPYLDHTDPFMNPNGGPILTTPPFAYLSDTPDVDDNNILVVAKTRIIIPTAGEYTFQVRSDDGFALRVKGQSWTAMSGAGYIDPLDPTTLVYELGTGDSNTRGVLNLAAGQYDVEFVNWEGTGGSFFEVTASTGNRLNPGEAQWLPLGSTATVAPINTFNAVRLTADATVTNANVRDRGNVLPAMRNIIENAITNGSNTVTSAPRPNLELAEGDNSVAVDLESTSRFPFNNAIIPVPPPDPPNPPYADNFITKVAGSFIIDADANENGTANEVIDITFGLFCDDGASMRIIGQDFDEVQGGDGGNLAALIDNGGDMTLTADFYTGNTNSRGRIALTEGMTYSFVCYMYEGGGGSNFNLRWELGDSLGGLGSPTALRTAAVNDDALNLVADATVTNCTNAFPSPFLAQARAILAEAAAQGVTQTGITPLVLINETTAAAGTGSIVGGATFSGTRAVFPVGAADNFATKVNGRLVVNNGNGTAGETVTVTFGVFADDGAELRIIGQDFLSVAGTNVLLADVSGDMAMVADFYTGNTNAFGTIDLVEGEYNFEGFHYEGGGGSAYEVWWALGTYTAFDPAAFRILNTTTGLSLPGNTGIALAAGVAPAAPFSITAFSINAGTGEYSLTFGSATGTNYAVEYTIGFLPAGAPPSAQKWTVVPSKSSVAGAAGTTTVTGNISEIVTPGGLLPDGQVSFFRVRSL